MHCAALLVALGMAVHTSRTPCAVAGSPVPRPRLTMRVRDAGFLRGDARATGTTPCSSWPHGKVEACRTQLRLRGGAAADGKSSSLVRTGAMRGGRQQGAGRVLTRKERRQKAVKAEERTVRVRVAYIKFLAQRRPRRLGPRYRQLLLPAVSARRRQSCFQVQRARECAFSSGDDCAAPRACLCVSVRLSKQWIQKHAWRHP